MKWYRIAALVISLFVIVLAATSLSARTTGNATSGSHFVRIPATVQADFNRLGLTPTVSLDYGSFYWYELNDADFTALAASAVPFSSAASAGQVHITTHQFDPLNAGEPDIAPQMRAGNNQPGFHLVQFAGPVQGEWLSALAAAGLPPLQYYPHHTYLTWGATAVLENITSLPFVRWQGPVHPAYKIDGSLKEFNDYIQNVDIMFYNDGNIDATLNAIQAQGAVVLQHFPSQPDKSFYNAIVEVDAAALANLARINTVLWLGYVGPEPILDDEMSSQIVAGNHPGGTPVLGYNAHLAALGVDGTGVTWAVIDTGVDYDHPDLGPNIVGGYSFPGACNTNPGEDCSNGGHGTHVAGIIGGTAAAGHTDANGFLYGLGIAPGYGIFAMNSLSAAAWPPAGGWQEHSKQAVLGGAIGGNNSWTTGEGTNHGYQASERTHDIMVRDGNFDTAAIAEPFIEVFSAGNSGPNPNTLTAPKEGKNLIIVASSQNFRVGSIDTISGFSSRGPAVDGRWVPTIAAPGEVIASTRNDVGGVCATAIPGTSNLYAFCSGTSMAAPQVAGAIVLFTEWWRGFNSGDDPSPAMAKALLVNGAVDMGTADIPNIHEGWGRVNITNIISPSVPFVFYDQTHLFTDTGQQFVLTAGVVDPSKPVKISLAWSDAPGAAGANPALVNNLNLTVANNGNTYLGNNFSGGWSATGGSADNLNNLENVYIQNPGGDLTITIDAANIAGDGVPYNGDTTDQDFALVCQNCALGSDFTLSAIPTTQEICAGADALYTINVGSVLGFNDPVTLSVTGNPAGTTANFDTNPVTPPGSSDLTIGNTGAVAFGSYSMSVVGVAPTSTHTVTVGLDLFTAAPGAPTLLTPANGAANVPVLPTFDWNAPAQAGDYLLEIATDFDFSNIVYSTSTNATSHTLPGGNELNTSATYYWRVQAGNICGDSNYSAIFNFTTEPAPGDCSPGTTPTILFSEDMESGAPGWTSSAGIGTNTWALSSANPHNGSMAYHADNIASISDQYLVSPAVVLPGGQLPLTLQFWNYQHIENRTAGGCYDGAVLEVSTNGGGSWTRLESELLTDPYDGLIDSGFGNPLSGQNAWCGSPQPYLNSIVDINAWAGETVQFRFRLATDNSLSRPGWDIDDVLVQSCMPAAQSVSLSAAQTVASGQPGETVTYTLYITNTGSISDTYDLNVSGHAWASVVTPDAVTLNAGESDTVWVAVTIPGDAPASATDSVLTTATSQTDPSANDSVVLNTTAEAAYGVLLVADDNALNGEPGATVTYTIQITNTGNVSDTFTLSVSDEIWMTHATPITVTLGVGASTAVTVVVHIPADAEDGDSDTAIVTAVSQTDAGATDSLTLTTTAVEDVEIDFLIYLPVIMKP